jgi:hypothetical protein
VEEAQVKVALDIPTQVDIGDRAALERLRASGTVV